MLRERGVARQSRMELMSICSESVKLLSCAEQDYLRRVEQVGQVLFGSQFGPIKNMCASFAIERDLYVPI